MYEVLQDCNHQSHREMKVLNQNKHRTPHKEYYTRVSRCFKLAVIKTCPSEGPSCTPNPRRLLPTSTSGFVESSAVAYMDPWGSLSWEAHQPETGTNEVIKREAKRCAWWTHYVGLRVCKQFLHWCGPTLDYLEPQALGSWKVLKVPSLDSSLGYTCGDAMDHLDRTSP